MILKQVEVWNHLPKCETTLPKQKSETHHIYKWNPEQESGRAGHNQGWICDASGPAWSWSLFPNLNLKFSWPKLTLALYQNHYQSKPILPRKHELTDQNNSTTVECKL